MTCEYTFTYLTCQACNAKIHCDDCAVSLRERFLKEPGISAVEIDMPNHRIVLSFSSIDEDDLEEVLEDAGVFIS